MPQSTPTSITLLGKLRMQPADPDAWQEFVRRYRPRIYDYCLAFPLQPTDAEDVTQEVLCRLLKKLPTFEYDRDRSFRAWLKTVTRHVLCDFLADRSRLLGSGDSEVVRMLESVPGREGLAQQLEEEYDRELLEEALRRARARVSVRHWEAFHWTALTGLSGAEAAARLGMLVATVYTAKCKVQKIVREELQALEGLALH